MTRNAWMRGAWCLTLTVLTLMGGSLAAAGVENRDFTIFVDGKAAGNYRMTIQNQANGTVVMTGHAKVTVKKFFITYTYTYNGGETWLANRLVRLDSKTDDDGKKFEVTATAEGNNLRVKVNNQERLERWDVWTTSYWRLPDAKFRNGGIPLLDADTGKFIAGRLREVGLSQVTVSGQPTNCRHFRLTGENLQVDLWYDSQDRLVREESVEDGHKTILELAKQGVGR